MTLEWHFQNIRCDVCGGPVWYACNNDDEYIRKFPCVDYLVKCGTPTCIHGLEPVPFDSQRPPDWCSFAW